MLQNRDLNKSNIKQECILASDTKNTLPDVN